jgi:hypothetical protein
MTLRDVISLNQTYKGPESAWYHVGIVPSFDFFTLTKHCRGLFVISLFSRGSERELPRCLASPPYQGGAVALGDRGWLPLLLTLVNRVAIIGNHPYPSLERRGYRADKKVGHPIKGVLLIFSLLFIFSPATEPELLPKLGTDQRE